MAEKIFYVSRVFNKQWTVSEWRAQWHDLQHWRYTNEMGFTFTVHDCCCNQHNPIDYDGRNVDYAIYTFGWGGRWYYNSSLFTDNGGGSGPEIEPFRKKHPGYPTEREAIAECFAQMLATYQDPKIKSELQKGLIDFRAQDATQLKLF